MNSTKLGPCAPVRYEYKDGILMVELKVQVLDLSDGLRKLLEASVSKRVETTLVFGEET